MSKKPTEPFGYIAFGRDRSVRKHIELLPANSHGQEIEAGRRLAQGLSDARGCSYEVAPLPQRDHDLSLSTGATKVIVQATEIFSRDYLRPIKIEDYLSGSHPFRNVVGRGPREVYGIDEVARNNALLERIGSKKQRYGKQREPLWLLVWTVADYFPFWVEQGRSRVDKSVIIAQEHLAAEGSGPFDEIWFLHLSLRPHRLWPASWSFFQLL